jgi:8-oxo-dGTP pyrophosphatase MutT (NUDIX family)
MTSLMITLDSVRAALALPDFDALGAHILMSPRPRGTPPLNVEPREAGVLALLFLHDDGQLHLVLTRRTESLRGHSGQISFPGGRRDDDDPDFAATALRETCEELGLCDDIEIVGSLTQIYIPPSNFNVYPFVGYRESTPYFRPNEDEVAEVFTVPLSALLDEAYKSEELRVFQYKGETIAMRVPYYALCGHKVWGATAIMLSEFEQRLRHVPIS